MGAGANDIELVCHALETMGSGPAAGVAREKLPFSPTPPRERSLRALDAARVFLRDGFLGRYSGERLVYPGVLRLLSWQFPDLVPYHPNWKLGACHPAYWILYPTVDHVTPVARGGTDARENLVTTSMLRSAAKGHWLLNELGWRVQPHGDLASWDGLLGWFRTYLGAYREPLACAAVRRWYMVALRATMPANEARCS